MIDSSRQRLLVVRARISEIIAKRSLYCQVNGWRFRLEPVTELVHGIYLTMGALTPLKLVENSHGLLGSKSSAYPFYVK